MIIKIDDIASDAGDTTKANEDRIGATDNFAFIIDGATGKTDKHFIARGESTDAAWLAEQMYHFLLEQFSPYSDIRLEFYRCSQYLHHVFDANAYEHPQNPWEYPSASLVMASIADETLIFGSLGDCTALVQFKDGSLEVFGGDPVQQALDRHVISLANERSTPPMSLSQKRKTVLQEIRDNQLRINQPDGYGSLSLAFPDPRDNTRILSIPANQITNVMLVSDGLYALVEDYHRYTDDQLITAAKNVGLTTLVTEARSIEAADPQGLYYPRLKKSDDASGIMFRLES